MRIQRLVLGRTINTGNYESVRCDMDVEVVPGDDIETVVKALEADVETWEKSLKAKYAKK